jgi:hypothetical protein
VIPVGRLETRDRAAWQELFAGHHAFCERPDWPRENDDATWERILEL